MSTEVDKHDPAGMAAWLRERAKANREIAALPREQWPYRPAVLQHWALRFEQAAEMFERQNDALRAIAGYLGPLDYNAEQMRDVARNALTRRG